MAKLDQGSIKSDVNPTIIKTGIIRAEGDIIDKVPIKSRETRQRFTLATKINTVNVNNEISKEEFQSFVRVRNSGVTNMFDIRAVSQFSGVEKEQVITIIKNFNSLSRKFPEVVK